MTLVSTKQTTSQTKCLPPGGQLTSEMLPEEHHPFVSEGFVSLSEKDTQVPLKVLRDKGASQSLLISAPVLAAPNLSKPFVLTIDASDVGTGAISMQEDEKDHPLGYFSYNSKESQRNYSTSEKRHWHCYLLCDTMIFMYQLLNYHWWFILTITLWFFWTVSRTRINNYSAGAWPYKAMI